MKLATIRNGSRDGRLVVVSRDLTRYTDASFLAPNMQAALDDWQRISPHLAALSDSLDHGALPFERFHEHEAMSPLPRAHFWADAEAYPSHLELMRHRSGQPAADNHQSEPAMHLGAPDPFLGARQPVLAISEAWGIDIEAKIVVIAGDVPLGISAKAALGHVRLLALAGEACWRSLSATELAKGFGYCQSRGLTAFSPVAVTPDELGSAWSGGKVSLPLQVQVNGAALGSANAGEGMAFNFGELIAHAAKTRPLGAGAVIGSGVVSNRDAAGGFSRPAGQGGRGFSCLAELRAAQALAGIKPQMPYLCFGDTLRIEMKDAKNHSIFGAIEQKIEKASAARG